MATTSAAERRRQILEAAVRVFARRGYHTARVGEIAKEAGVAYGLVYHYFDSKEAVLRNIFVETWTNMLATIEAIEAGEESAREQLRKVVELVLRTWRRDPDLVRVLVREVTRAPQISEEIEEIENAFEALQRIVERGQQRGEFRDDIDARLASWILYGSMEEILTGWVLGRLDADDTSIAAAEQTVLSAICEGLMQR